MFYFIYIICVLLGFAGNLTLGEDYSGYSEVILFVSVIIGFQTTALVIIFSSPLKRDLWNLKNERHGTELHRLAFDFRVAFAVNIIMVFSLIALPVELQTDLEFTNVRWKTFFVFPALSIAAATFWIMLNRLLRLLVIPTNDG